MDKNTVYAGYLGPRTLTSAALSVLLAANTAASQDLATTGRISSDYSGSVTIDEESLVTNFEDRWSGVETSEKEFVLGANGVVTKGGAEVLGATALKNAGAKGIKLMRLSARILMSRSAPPAALSLSRLPL